MCPFYTAAPIGAVCRKLLSKLAMVKHVTIENCQGRLDAVYQCTSMYAIV